MGLESKMGVGQVQRRRSLEEEGQGRDCIQGRERLR